MGRGNIPVWEVLMRLAWHLAGVADEVKEIFWI